MSKVIALDIGHGNNTFPPGKGVYRNGKGYAEFDFNNKLGKRTKKLLEHNGFKVIMAQPFDSNDVPLINRTNYYDKMGADLGISQHANAGNSKVGGRCAFYWHSSKQGKQFATNIIQNMIDKGYGIHGSGLHASQYNSWTNLHMIRECTTFPMVLVEHGFMTNSLDFPLIFGNKQNQYIEDMADCDVKAVCDYFGVKFKTLDSKMDAPVAPAKPKPAKRDSAEWKTNKHGTQYKPLKGTWVNGKERIHTRQKSPFRSARSGGWLKPGATVHFKEIVRQDGHIWLGYYNSDGVWKYVPVKKWNPVTGEVGDDWGTFK